MSAMGKQHSCSSLFEPLSISVSLFAFLVSFLFDHVWAPFVFLCTCDPWQRSHAVSSLCLVSGTQGSILITDWATSSVLFTVLRFSLGCSSPCLSVVPSVRLSVCQRSLCWLSCYVDYSREETPTWEKTWTDLMHVRTLCASVTDAFVCTHLFPRPFLEGDPWHFKHLQVYLNLRVGGEGLV